MFSAPMQDHAPKTASVTQRLEIGLLHFLSDTSGLAAGAAGQRETRVSFMNSFLNYRGILVKVRFRWC